MEDYISAAAYQSSAVQYDRSGLAIPYYRLGEVVSLNLRASLKRRVLVGPSPHQNLNLRSFLYQLFQGQALVKPSEIPYRS